jgi:ribosomal protein L17
MEIEQLPASEQQTKVSAMAADLLREVEATEADLVTANCMLEDAQERISKLKKTARKEASAWRKEALKWVDREALLKRLCGEAADIMLDACSETEDNGSETWMKCEDCQHFCNIHLLKLKLRAAAEGGE